GSPRKYGPAVDIGAYEDTSRPVIQAASSSGTQSVTATQSITGSITTTSNITSFTAALDSGSYVDVSSALVGDLFSFDLTELTTINGGLQPAYGTPTLNVRATNAAGNVATPFDLTFTLDTTLPVIHAALSNDTGSSKADTITSDPSLTGTIADATDSITSLMAAYDSGSFVDGSSRLSPGSVSFNQTSSVSFDQAETTAINRGTSLADGPHTLHLLATDQAGNVALQFDLAFTLDTTKPVIGAALSNDTSGGSKITTDPSVAGTIADATDSITSFTAA